MHLLLISRDEPRGTRRDAYYGAFLELQDAKDNGEMLSDRGPLTWRHLKPGTGPFESYCNSVLRGSQLPKAVMVADVDERTRVAIVEFEWQS